MFQVRDRVVVRIYGMCYHGTIVNISDYREPSMKYAVDLDEYREDLIFVPEEAIEGILYVAVQKEKPNTGTN